MHPAWTYALRDLGGSLWGTLVFAAAMFAPGYLVGRATNVCEFCTRGLREQMAWSLALSVGVGTILLVALVWAVGVVVTGWLLVAMTVVAGVLLARASVRVDISRKQSLVAAAVFAAWTLFVVGSLIDLPHGDGLAMSVTTFDHAVRTAMVGTVMRTGVVPANPLYWPGHAAGLRYYYFWYVTCGVVARLAHITARQALVASCVWPLVSVATMLALFGRHMLGWNGNVLRRRWWTGVALMSVTGLDLLMVLWSLCAGGTIDGDMEWWSANQVTSWADTFLWVPHHAMSMVCCVFCLMLLWMASREAKASARVMLAVLAGLSFASGFGLSNYVGAAMAIIAVAWLGWRLFTANKMRVLSACVISGVVGIVALTPYLAQLLHKHGGESLGAGGVLGIGVRTMLPPEMLMGLPWLKALAVHHEDAATQLSALLLLIPGYAVELGFFGFVLLQAWRQRKGRGAGEATVLFWTLAALAVSTFLCSKVISTNDFGIRATLLAQFGLLLLAVQVLERSSKRARVMLLCLALIGVSGTIFQVVVLRISLPRQEAKNNIVFGDMQLWNYALRDAWTELDTKIPSDARVQYKATDNDNWDQTQMIQARRQLISGDDGCDTSFGGDTSVCPGIQQAIGQLYQLRGQSPVPVMRAAAWCSSIGAQYLIATRWDPAWQDRQGWVWQLPVVVERPDVRVVTCAPLAR